MIEVSVQLANTVCDDVRTLIVERWGAGEQLWIDRAQHRRASLVPVDEGGCRLNFDRFVEDAAWVDSALPKLLGKTHAQVEKLLGDDRVEGELRTYLPGPPSGLDVTRLEVEFSERGTANRVDATTVVTGEEAAAIIAAISKKLGRQPTDDGGAYRWGAHTSLTYDDSSRLELIQEL